MDTTTALFNDSVDFFDAYLSTVIDFERTARTETTLVNRKENGIKKRSVLFVKRAIDKNIAVIGISC